MIVIDFIQKKILNLLIQSPKAKQNPMKYIRETTRDFAFKSLEQSIINCNTCKTPCIYKKPFYLNKPPSLMVIMDYPYENQAIENNNFFEGIPKVKELLDKTFDKFGADPLQIFYMNTVCGCMTREVVLANQKISHIYRPPTKSEIENCSTFVKYAIDIIHPPIIILMGNVALNIFLHEPIVKARGKWVNAYTIPAMATYNPNYLIDIKGQIDECERRRMFQDFFNDIEAVIKKYKREWPNSKFLKG